VSTPFYVSPEQLMQDKAEYARKGIGRGKSSLVLEFQGGIVLVAENPSSLSKIGEIYDRIAFSGVGKFSEFDQLRKIGVRYADMKGYSYSRDDVRAKGLANAYSQAMGDVFTREMKPLEVEVIVAEVGDPELAGHENSTIYRVQFDGSITDHEGYCVIGGTSEDIGSHLQSNFRAGLSMAEAVQMGHSALERNSEGRATVSPEHLEVCVLEKSRIGRKFRRLTDAEIEDLVRS
jgi:proteasome alpha subunit